MTSETPTGAARPRARGLATIAWCMLLAVAGGCAQPPMQTAPSGDAAASAAPAGGTAPAATPTEQDVRLSGGRPKIFGPPPGMTLFGERCAGCHTEQGLEINGRIVPTIAAMKATSPERILQSMTAGKMVTQATGLSDIQKKQIAEFVAGRPVASGAETIGVAAMTNRCASNPPLPDPASTANWNGWSPDVRNARFQDAAAAGLRARDVPKLKLKWAFGLPFGGSSSSQPTVAAGRVFVGSDNTALYSLDAKTGCVYWAYIAGTAGRFAPVVAPVAGDGGRRYAVFFATGPGSVFALDAHDGQLIWKTQLEGMLSVSASTVYHDGRLYVPITGTETVAGSNPDYECCRSRGGIAALDASTGRLVWKADSIAEPLAKAGRNQKGVQLWGPSGAGIWNTPTIDARRGLIYAGTGNSYGLVAATTSDSVIAMDMRDGRIVWSHQEFKGDAFMLFCGDRNERGGNCPEVLGPDWDFGGASVILETLPNGRDVVVAAGKGGIAIALDPQRNGALLWRTKLYDKEPPTADGLVLFGGTADGRRVYFPLQRPGGGLAALRLDTGVIDWTVGLDADPRGQIGAASAIAGVVFTGGWDGILRAVDSTGKVMWRYDTRREFQTVNGVNARGGSLGSPGPTIADGMVYVASGYPGMQGGYPGNVILAFSAE